MSLNTLSDSTAGGEQNGTSHPTSLHSSRWAELQRLDQHIASLELGGVGQPVNARNETNDSPGFVLAILDAHDVKQVCSSITPSTKPGFHAGSKTANRLSNIVTIHLDEEQGRQKAETLLYFIDHANDARSSVLESFIQGFNDGLSVLGVALGVAFQVCSPDAAEAKALSLIRLHGHNSACLRIVASHRFWSAAKGGELEIWPFDTMLSMCQTQASEEPGPHSPGSDGGAFVEVSPAVEVDQEQLSAIFTGPGTREVDYDVPIWKQSPPICHNYVLTGECPHGDDCKFGHYYNLTDEDVDALATAVRRMPCDSVKNDTRRRSCPLGDACLFGHTCPYDEKCSWPRCKFIDAAHPKKMAMAKQGARKQQMGVKTKASWRRPSPE